MKVLASTALFTALALGFAGTADAQRFETRVDRARVVDVDRVYTTAPGRLVQECWNERTRRYDAGYYRDDRGRLYRDGGKDSGTEGALIGALVGGVLGNQVGDGNGRRAATVAGALIGGKVGHDIDERDGYGRDRYDNDDRQAYDDRGRYDDDYRYRRADGIETRCRTVQTASHNRMEGFRVTYVYSGQSRTTFMRNHPGRTIPVEVDLRQGRRGRVAIMDVRPRDAFVADYSDWRDY